MTVAAPATARQAAGRPPFFQRSGDAGATSYFERPSVTVMRPADVEFPGGGTAEGLIDALAALWTAEGETGLAAMAPRLKEIASALKEEAEQGDGSVDILCYTMF